MRGRCETKGARAGVFQPHDAFFALEEGAWDIFGHVFIEATSAQTTPSFARIAHDSSGATSLWCIRVREIAQPITDRFQIPGLSSRPPEIVGNRFLLGVLLERFIAQGDPNSANRGVLEFRMFG